MTQSYSCKSSDNFINGVKGDLFNKAKSGVTVMHEKLHNMTTFIHSLFT